MILAVIAGVSAGPDADVAAPNRQADDDVLDFPATSGPWRYVDRVALGGLLVVALGLRFTARSPMWLDEALTVHISSLPVGQIPEALRHDGHPPLYYVLLHYWMKLVGTSNMAIRALPGLFGVATIPLLWIAARRVGGRSAAYCTFVLVALLPFALRYSTENRMYSMVMLLAIAAWLLVDSALRRPGALTLVGVTLCTSALLWSHYWAMWLGAATVICLVYRLAMARRQNHPTEESVAIIKVLGALGIGALTFLPWVPTLLYQSAHTGTPWGSRTMPATVLITTVQDLGGGPHGDQVMSGWVVMLAAIVGLFALAIDDRHLDFDLRGRARTRPLIVVTVLTLGIAMVVMLATNSAFQGRYNAVWVPFVLLVGGVGLSRFRAPVVGRCVLAAVVLIALPGAGRNAISPRTQARSAAHAIEAHGTAGDIVAVCPDQLGPSLMRELSPGFVVGTYPRFGDPRTVDWVDYVARTHAVPPAEFAKTILARAGNHKIFLVWSGNYKTHNGLCEATVQALQETRPNVSTRLAAVGSIAESENVFEFDASPRG